ncbi:MAG: hypothetical protein ACU0BB_08770 [Paracoccaceae bacterium]
MTTLFCAIVLQSKLKIDHPVLRRWNALALRETRRHQILSEQAKCVTEVARKLNLTLVEMRGLRISRQIYPAPEARHCHALRYIVEPAEMRPRLVSALLEHWEAAYPGPPLAKENIRLTSPGRVEVILYCGLAGDGISERHSHLKHQADADAVDILAGAVLDLESHSDRWITDFVFLARHQSLSSEDIALSLLSLGIPSSVRAALTRLETLVPADCASISVSAKLLHALGNQPDSITFRWRKARIKTRVFLSMSYQKFRLLLRI